MPLQRMQRAEGNEPSTEGRRAGGRRGLTTRQRTGVSRGKGKCLPVPTHAQAKGCRDLKEAVRSATWIVTADQGKEDFVGTFGEQPEAADQGVNKNKEVVTAGGRFHLDTQVGKSLEDAWRRAVPRRRVERIYSPRRHRL